MNPSSSHASVGDDGPSPEEKGGGGRGQHPQGGNGAKLCAVSLDGDEDARRASCGGSVSRTRRAENAQFCAGSRRRNSQVAPRCGLKLVAVADAAPGNWTFLEKLRPDERAVDFFHARRGFRSSRATGTKNTAPSCATTPTARPRYLRDKVTPALKVPEREVFPQAQAPPTRASRPKAMGQALFANKVLVNQRMKRRVGA